MNIYINYFLHYNESVLDTDELRNEKGMFVHPLFACLDTNELIVIYIHDYILPKVRALLAIPMLSY